MPLTLVLAAVWQLRVGPMLAYVAPAAIRRRGIVVAGAGWWTSPMRVVGGVAGAAIGVATHLAWDSATHWSGYIVHHVPALLEVVQVPVLGPLPLHRVIQHISSLVGLVAVVVAAIVAIRARPRRTPAAAADDDGILVAVTRRAGRVALALCFVGGEAFAFARLVVFHRSEATAPDSLVVAAISGALLACLVAGALIRSSRPSLLVASTGGAP